MSFFDWPLRTSRASHKCTKNLPIHSRVRLLVHWRAARFKSAEASFPRQSALSLSLSFSLFFLRPRSLAPFCSLVVKTGVLPSMLWWELTPRWGPFRIRALFLACFLLTLLALLTLSCRRSTRDTDFDKKKRRRTERLQKIVNGKNRRCPQFGARPERLRARGACSSAAQKTSPSITCRACRETERRPPLGWLNVAPPSFSTSISSFCLMPTSSIRLDTPAMLTSHVSQRSSPAPMFLWILQRTDFYRYLPILEFFDSSRGLYLAFGFGDFYERIL